MSAVRGIKNKNGRYDYAEVYAEPDGVVIFSLNGYMGKSQSAILTAKDARRFAQAVLSAADIVEGMK